MMGDMWHSMRQQQLGDETEATYLDKVLEEARTKEPDPINPTHYTRFPVEPIEILECLPYNRASAAKYIIRCEAKGDNKDAITDLKKAIWFIQRELKRLENNISVGQR